MKTTTLDVKGLSCPLPVLRAAKAVKGRADCKMVSEVVRDILK